jgi:hypothetical protein
MHRDGLLDDESILSELSDCLSGVCGGDFGGFVGIKPNLALSAVQNVCRKALLRAEVDPTMNFELVLTNKAKCFDNDKTGIAKSPFHQMQLVVTGLFSG